MVIVHEVVVDVNFVVEVGDIVEVVQFLDILEKGPDSADLALGGLDYNFIIGLPSHSSHPCLSSSLVRAVVGGGSFEGGVVLEAGSAGLETGSRAGLEAGGGCAEVREVFGRRTVLLRVHLG